VAHHKRGHMKNVERVETFLDPSKSKKIKPMHDRNFSTVAVARPKIELSPEERACSVFTPKKYIPEVQVMSRTFKNFNAYQRDRSPPGEVASKIDYHKYRSRVLADRKLYDSNLEHNLST
jgi:hypothetical protein